MRALNASDEPSQIRLLVSRQQREQFAIVTEHALDNRSRDLVEIVSRRHRDLVDQPEPGTCANVNSVELDCPRCPYDLTGRDIGERRCHRRLVYVGGARCDIARHRREARLLGARRNDARRLGGETDRLFRAENHVAVVRQHDHLRRGRRLDRRDDVRGGRIHRLAALDHTRRAVALEQPTIPGARGNHDDPGFQRRDVERRARARLRFQPLLALGGLALHVRDLDAFDRTDPCSESERGAGIVGVDVDLQRARITNDEQRVTELLQLTFELLGVERFPFDDENGAVAVARLLEMDRVEACRRLIGDRLRESLTGGAGGEPPRDLQQACTARVDDACGLQHREQLGRARDSLLPARNHAPQELDLRQCEHIRLLTLLRHLADNSEHRSFYGAPHGAVGGIARRAERLREHRGVDLLVLGQHIGKATDDLREDDARVPARPHQRGATQLLSNRRLPTGAGLLERLYDSANR